ncbi:MAG: homoserine O-acetyltransferase [Rikenellaceae bacterium]|jgi:homoserine O-acetyltransferase|nr:homoserine O-acetyltransferase [Rikenellaceae bacterium]
MPVRHYTYDKPLKLENGEELPGLQIAYHTYGKFRGDNVVWVCHALTANSDVADWWPHAVEQGRFLDPAKYFIVCANILGSHYGSTGPLSVNPATGEPWYGSFPFISVRDMANAHFILAEHLGVERCRVVIGSSIGGFQAMEMAIMRPDFAERLVLIATAARSQPWAIALNESQRMAIETDSTWGSKDEEGGKKGMRCSRSIGLISYRGSAAYNATQQEHDTMFKLAGFRATTYQQYQGEKLSRRFNAYSYYRLSQAFDSHNVGRYRGGIEHALGLVTARTMVIGISSDIIFPVTEQIFLYRNIPDCRIELLSSDFGHDGFLVEYEKLNSLLIPFLK